MKIRDRLEKLPGGKIAQITLELAESPAGVIEMHGILHDLIGSDIVDIDIGAPEITFGTLIDIASICLRDETERFTGGIAALLDHFFSDMLCDGYDIFHQVVGFFKYFMIDPLKSVKIPSAMIVRKG